MVNADDFGFTRDVNQGIVEAHQHGILTATTLMANGEAFDDAVRLAGENPTLDIGGAPGAGRRTVAARRRARSARQRSAACWPRSPRGASTSTTNWPRRCARILDAGIRLDASGYAQTHAPGAAGAGRGGAHQRGVRHPLGAAAFRSAAHVPHAAERRGSNG